MKIITNHHYRFILHWHELTDDEQRAVIGMHSFNYLR